MLRTYMLMAAMTALFLVIGLAIGSTSGMMIALVFALGSNLFAYWNSDRMALRMYRAHPLDTSHYRDILRDTQTFAERAEIPVPKLYLINMPQPNAFATGRTPEKGVVAVSTGLLERLSHEEVMAVIAHELAHIANRDTLVMTVTASLAGAISAIANFAIFFGARGDHRNPIVSIAIAILAPLAASIVQFAISRTREYHADAEGARISQNPLALASALAKISNISRIVDNDLAESNPATAHMFISNPLHVHAIDGLFSTHPKTERRITALEQIAAEMGSRDYTAAPSATKRNKRRSTFGFTNS